MDQQLKPYEIAILAAGAVALIGSFLDWIGNDFFGYNAWDSDFLFPLITWAPLCLVAMAIVMALTKFANVSLPDEILGFTWPQIHFVLADFAALIMIGFLVAGSDLAIGFWLTLLATGAGFYGALAMLLDANKGAAAGGQGPTTTTF